MAEDKSNMSYDTMLEMLIQNMKQLTGNTTSSCNMITTTYSILVMMKDRIGSDSKLLPESKEVILMQIDELFHSMEENSNGLFSSLSFLKEQLESYRVVYQKLKESGIVSGDMSSAMSFVEKSLSIGEKNG